MIWIVLAALGVPLCLVVGALGAGSWSRWAFEQAPGAFPAKLRLITGAAPGAEAPWPSRPVPVRWIHDVLLVHRGGLL
jgi:hypothetical protein